MSTFWKEDWDRARENLIKWWNLDGCAISIMSPADRPRAEVPPPEREIPFCQPNAPRISTLPQGNVAPIPVPENPREMWLDPELRFRSAEYLIANTFYGGEAFPYFDTHLGPGNLSAFLGSKPDFSETDAWFRPGMDDIDAAPPLVFDERNEWFQKQMDIIRYGVEHADGRFLTCFPLLTENGDTLASLRGTTEILTDMALDPEAVKRRVAEINVAFAEASRRIFDLIRDQHGGNSYSTFDIWAPGRTAVIECDLSSMFSADMYEEMILPGLVEQCEDIDYVMYHLDGSQCLQHLDHILSIEKVRIVQWTPDPGKPGGGDPAWYDLYNKIKKAGKGVQAIWIKPEEIDPLLEAIGRKASSCRYASRPKTRRSGFLTDAPSGTGEPYSFISRTLDRYLPRAIRAENNRFITPLHIMPSKDCCERPVCFLRW